MQEQFDKILTDKIRTTFEDYSEPYNSDAWILMKKKLTKKKDKRIILFFNIAKAASVILFIGIGVLFQFSTNRIISYNNTSKTYIDTSKTKESTNNIFLKNENIILDRNLKPVAQYSIKNYKNIREKETLVKNNSTNTRLEDEFIPINAIDTFLTEQKNKNISNKNQIVNIGNNKKDSIYLDTLKNIKPILNPDKEEYFVKSKKKKKLNFGIAVSSHYSTSNIGATDKINLSGGISTEYLISDKISINSGVILANHNLNNEQYPNSKYTDPISNNSVYEDYEKTNIKLLGIDIPLNIKFDFDKMYISTGVSSLVYIKESYSTDFYEEKTKQVYNAATNKYDIEKYFAKANTTSNKGAFKKFDFAKLFNLSFGYKIPLKKGNIVFEPYAKIPIGQLTSYNIYYGYGGIALKYNF